MTGSCTQNVNAYALSCYLSLIHICFGQPPLQCRQRRRRARRGAARLDQAIVRAVRGESGRRDQPPAAQMCIRDSSITGLLVTATDFTRQIAAGNLSTPLPPASIRDEIGALKFSLEVMRKSLVSICLLYTSVTGA